MPGLPKKYAKMGFKKGWIEYRKALKKRGKSTSKNNKKKNNSKPKSNGSRGGSGMRLSKIFKWLRLGALAYPAVNRWVTGAGTTQQKALNILADYTGLKDGKFNLNRMIQTYVPFLATTAITVAVEKAPSFIRKMMK